MWSEIIELLCSELRADRIAGWTQLRQDFTGSPANLAPERWEILTGLLLDEPDEGVRHMGQIVLLGLACPAGGNAPPPPRCLRDAGSLAHWLWRPFYDKSAVFSRKDQQRRDELAVLDLRGHLCRHHFPKTDFHFMEVDDPGWDELLFGNRFQSLCFVGRLGIFGIKAARRWGSSDCRFKFLLDHRPAGLKRFELHSEYHCIAEREVAGADTLYRTQQQDGVREDYGLVQRYLVRDGSRKVPVLVCAGGSALGTLAAAMWATTDLTERLHADSPAPLPAPPGLTLGSSFEALIHVTADVTEYAWQPKHLELRKLFAGRHVWSSDDDTWSLLTPTQVELVLHAGKAVEIWIDGKRLAVKKGSQNFKLIVAMAEGVRRRGDGIVTVAELAKDRSIWGGKTRSAQHVRNRLSQLKFNYLGNCLVFDTDIVFRAEVVQREIYQ